MAKRILVQMGHVAPREPGFESGTGTVREQELTRKLGGLLKAKLDADPAFDCILVPGDIPNGIKCDAAIFLHGDGSASKTSRGYSYGFPEFAVNRRLRDLLQEEYEKLPGHPPKHTDNYTGGLRGYYGYSRVNTAGPEVLIEHGFLTNPTDQAWIFAHLPEIANAHYRAIRRYFKMAPLPAPPKPDPVPVPDILVAVGTASPQRIRYPNRTKGATKLLAEAIEAGKPFTMRLDR